MRRDAVGADFDLDRLGLHMIEVPLTRGLVALIDDEDALMICRHRWMAWSSGHTWYAVREVPRPRRLIWMHREIMGRPPRTVQIDHVNRNGLDNRRENLRRATSQQQRANAGKYSTACSSRFKGVGWSINPELRAGGRWRARIQIGGKAVFRSARSEIEAAQRYNDLAREYFGEFACFNDVSGLEVAR